MFEINLNPRNFDQHLTLDREGDVLYLNGEAFDFSLLAEGATLPSSAVSSDWFFGDIERVDGVIKLTLWLPHGANAPESTRFPTPLAIVDDGPVDLPIYDIIQGPESEDANQNE